MEVTEDNVFLVTLQGENELHIRTFITGTYLHVLKRHKAKVRNKPICIVVKIFKKIRKAKRGVDFRHSTRNRWKVDRSVLMGTEYLITLFRDCLCLPCYMRDTT